VLLKPLAQLVQPQQPHAQLAMQLFHFVLIVLDPQLIAPLANLVMFTQLEQLRLMEVVPNTQEPLI